MNIAKWCGLSSISCQHFTMECPYTVKKVMVISIFFREEHRLRASEKRVLRRRRKSRVDCKMCVLKSFIILLFI
jgi:hypothetical protein